MTKYHDDDVAVVVVVRWCNKIYQESWSTTTAIKSAKNVKHWIINIHYSNTKKINKHDVLPWNKKLTNDEPLAQGHKTAIETRDTAFTRARTVTFN